MIIFLVKATPIRKIAKESAMNINISILDKWLSFLLIFWIIMYAIGIKIGIGDTRRSNGPNHACTGIC